MVTDGQKMKKNIIASGSCLVLPTESAGSTQRWLKAKFLKTPILIS